MPESCLFVIIKFISPADHAGYIKTVYNTMLYIEYNMSYTISFKVNASLYIYCG